MRISSLLLIICLAGATVASARAQVLTREQQDKMLEVLRQQMGHPPEKPSAPARTPTPATAQRLEEIRQSTAQPKPAVRPTVGQDEAATAAQRRALEVLRKAMAEQTPPPAASEKQPSVMQAAPAPAPAKPSPASVAVTPRPTAPGAVAPNTPAATPTPSAPKTKQEKLTNLLEQYRADKISPSEYHQQRAKILAEP